MRLREALVLVASASILLVGCSSRLSFVKSDAQRRGMDRVAPEYNFSETTGGRQQPSARRLLASAEQKYRAGQAAEAAADARAALKIDSRSVEAHTMLGLLASRAGESVAAGRHFSKAAELGANDGVALSNYGAWLCANGRSADSLSWFERALSARGYAEREAALANAGACALAAGQPELAERASRAALDIAPANVVALNTMAEHNYASGRYFEARAFSQRRLAAAPATPEALRLASQIEEKLGDSVAATRYVQRLRTEFPQARIAGPGEAETK
ncbi:MAG: type IV pilus biogenesis/stability protein PilW [Luteimonas sp.]|nr:type IV pilus biogenesis/stability protein PilW [Luteimonas sp.]